MRRSIAYRVDKNSAVGDLSATLQFQMTDAQEVFRCITPAIAKFMPWEPPSWSEYVARCEKRMQAPEPDKFSFVIRRLDNRKCLGMASFEDADSVSPELGLWLKVIRFLPVSP